MHKIVVTIVLIFLLAVLWLVIDYFMTVTFVGGSNIRVDDVKLVDENGRYLLIVKLYFDKKVDIPLISNPSVSVKVVVDDNLVFNSERIRINEKTITIKIPVPATSVFRLVQYDGGIVDVTVFVSSLWASRSLEFSVPFHVLS